MSDLVIKDFDTKAGNALVWLAVALLFLSLVLPIYYALHFAAAPASELLTALAKEQGVETLTASQRLASFVFLLPPSMMFWSSLLIGTLILGVLGLELRGSVYSNTWEALLKWSPAALVVWFGILAAFSMISLPMVDVVQTWGISTGVELNPMSKLPTSFLMMSGAISIAIIIHRAHTVTLIKDKAAAA